MKTRFINSLIRTMIEHKGYMPLRNNEGDLNIDKPVNILAKDSYGSYILVELLDGDKFTSEEITTRLKENRRILCDLSSGVAHYFFEVFIFESEPDKDKLDAITSCQFQKIMGKKYLKCISVDISKESVNKHFRIPISDLGLARSIKDILVKDISAETVNIENSDIKDLVLQKEKEYKIEFKVKVPVFTYALIIINIIIGAFIFVYSIKSGIGYDQLLLDFGAKVNSKILAGEYWRFITPVFLHANVMHLLINCYSLFAIGTSVEKIFGRFKFLTIYFIAGLLGNIASFMFSFSPGVGASGAIFGLLGTLLYFGIEKPALFRAYFGYNVIVTIIINLVYGFSKASIDNFVFLVQ